MPYHQDQKGKRYSGPMNVRSPKWNYGTHCVSHQCWCTQTSQKSLQFIMTPVRLRWDQFYTDWCEWGRETHCLLFKTFRENEWRFKNTERELLAVYEALQAYRPYIPGGTCVCYTDHRALIYMHKLENPSHYAMLGGCDWSIRYVLGKHRRHESRSENSV